MLVIYTSWGPWYYLSDGLFFSYECHLVSPLRYCFSVFIPSFWKNFPMTVRFSSGCLVFQWLSSNLCFIYSLPAIKPTVNVSVSCHSARHMFFSVTQCVYCNHRKLTSNWLVHIRFLLKTRFSPWGRLQVFCNCLTIGAL